MNPGILVKASVTPILIGTASWAGRRWGDALGGWLVGLPLTSGPIVLFLSLDHGPRFGAATAAGVLQGGLSQVGFAVVYAHAARRRGIAFALAAGTLAFAVLTVVLDAIAPPLAASLLLVALGLFAGVRLMPAEGGDDERSAASPPRCDIPLRMLLATALVLALTESAPYLGPRLSGLLAPFPLFAAVLAAFAHGTAGGGAAADVLRGLLYGLGSFCVFFAVAAQTLPELGAVSALALATAAALVVQGIALAVLRRAIR